MKKIIIAGGSGFIGQYLAQQFRDEGHKVIIISRQKKHVQWDDKEGMRLALENADWLINMAGRSVDCRYNAKNKAAILNSRIDTTRVLGEAIQQCANPPNIWFNSSTATIYRHEEHQPMTESQGIIGQGFSVDVAKQWEHAFFSFNLPATRQVALRIAIVLGKDGGALRPLKNLVRFGLGGPQGNGRQRFSWLHIEDLKDMIQFIADHAEIKGAVNCASPNAVTNKELMQNLRENMSVKWGLPSPAWLLKMGAIVIRTETELVLKSRWVYPERLLEAGYHFRYAKLKDALTDLRD